MKQFDIELHSFADVHAFVDVATVQPFRILVGNDRRRVNGKSFMGMFSLDYSEPLKVRVDCKEDQFYQFRQAAARFVEK